jgi:hypothetical protein
MYEVDFKYKRLNLYKLINKFIFIAAMPSVWREFDFYYTFLQYIENNLESLCFRKTVSRSSFLK